MILSERVFVKWSSKNRKHYEELGYGPYKYNEPFEVEVKHLQPNATVSIIVQCDYCEKPSKGRELRYSIYNKNVNEHPLQKYACKKCTDKKRKEHIQIKNSKGELKKGDPGWWSIPENQRTELKKYMESGSDKGSIYHTNLFNELKHHKVDLIKLFEDIGYTFDDARKYKPSNYWDSIENVVKEIEEFIKRENHFPRQGDFSTELGISQSVLQRHGGIIALKKHMGYNSENDLIDNNGEYNRSLGEVIVANFLLAQEIPYGRDEKPFPKSERKFRSDFTIRISGEKKPIHVEVWGYTEDTKIGVEYNIKRRLKEALYKYYEIPLIPIEPDVFGRYNKYEEISERLKDKFSKYLNLKYDTVEREKILPVRAYSDEELAEKAKRYCEDCGDKGLLITSKQLERRNYGLYIEIMRRFNSISDFAKKFNLSYHKETKGYWNDSTFIESFEYMVNKYTKVLSCRAVNSLETKDERLTKLIATASKKKNGGYELNRYKFYKYCLDNKKALSEGDREYLKRARCKNHEDAEQLEKFVNYYISNKLDKNE